MVKTEMKHDTWLKACWLYPALQTKGHQCLLFDVVRVLSTTLGLARRDLGLVLVSYIHRSERRTVVAIPSTY